MEIEGRTGKFLKNASGAALFQIVNMLCGIITPRFMLMGYGSEINGLVSSITQFLTALAVVESGLGTAAQISLYKPLAEKDYGKVSSLVSAARRAYLQVGYLFTALSIVLAFLYPIFAGVEGMSYGTMAALVLVLALHYALNYFIIAKYQVLFQADQRAYVISLAQVVSRAVNTICIVVMATLKAHILLLRICVTSSVVIHAVIIYIYAKKRYPFIDYYAKPDKSALNQRWDALYLSVLGTVQSSAPGILLTLVASLTSVSVYTVYSMVFTALMGVLGIFMNGVNASFGNLLRSKDHDRTKEVYAEFENAYYVLITIIYTTAMPLIVPFVRLYTQGITDAQYLLPGLGVLFAVNGLMYNLKTPQGMMVQAAGLFRQVRWRNTVQVAILLIGGLVLGYFFGIYGVVLASILSNTYRVIDLLFFIPKYVTKDSPWGSVRRVLLMLVCSIAVSSVAGIFVSNLEINNYFQWFVAAVTVFVFVAGSVALVDYIFERRNFLAVCKRIIGLLRRK